MTSRWDALKTPLSSDSASKSRQDTNYVRSPAKSLVHAQSKSFSNNLHRQADGSIRGNGTITKSSIYKSKSPASTESPLQKTKISGSAYAKKNRYSNPSAGHSTADLSKTPKPTVSKLRNEIQSYRNQFITKLDDIKSSETYSAILVKDNDFTKESVSAFAKTLRNSASKLLLDITQCSHASSPNGIDCGGLTSETLYLIFQGVESLQQSLTCTCWKGSANKNEEEKLEDLLTQVWSDITKAISSSERTSHDVNKNTDKIVSLLKLTPVKTQECASILVTRIKCILLWEPSDLDSTNGSGTRRPCGNVCISEKELCKIYSLCECLQHLIISFGRDFHAEQSVGSILRFAILPLLELNSILLIDKTKNIKVVAMECIIALVKWKQHASAMLAPLIVDVGSSGVDRKSVV